MTTRNNLLRVMFCVSLSLFVFAIFSPWAARPWYDSWDWSTFQRLQGEELHWSFQAVAYPYKDGFENRLLSWDFWFDPHDRLVLWDFWFNQSITSYGLTFGWIHLFILQLTTVLTGIYVLVRRWKKIKYSLIPLSSSILSLIAGLELVTTYGLVWSRRTHLYWGLPVAVFSTLLSLGTFLVRYLPQKCRKV